MHCPLPVAPLGHGFFPIGQNMWPGLLTGCYFVVTTGTTESLVAPLNLYSKGSGVNVCVLYVTCVSPARHNQYTKIPQGFWFWVLCGGLQVPQSQQMPAFAFSTLFLLVLGR
jgi:hypothetical protein